MAKDTNFAQEYKGRIETAKKHYDLDYEVSLEVFADWYFFVRVISATLKKYGNAVNNSGEITLEGILKVEIKFINCSLKKDGYLDMVISDMNDREFITQSVYNNFGMLMANAVCNTFITEMMNFNKEGKNG